MGWIVYSIFIVDISSVRSILFQPEEYKFRSIMNVHSFGFCWFVVILLSCFIDVITSNDRRLVVISLDAFKPLYLQQRLVPSMEKFYQNGVLATRMNNSFPTKTFVNHFSIATGEFQD